MDVEKVMARMHGEAFEVPGEDIGYRHRKVRRTGRARKKDVRERREKLVWKGEGRPGGNPLRFAEYKPGMGIPVREE